MLHSVVGRFLMNVIASNAAQAVRFLSAKLWDKSAAETWE